MGHYSRDCPKRQVTKIEAMVAKLEKAAYSVEKAENAEPGNG